MTCPVCFGETIVARSGAFSDSVVRRRKCKVCGYAFYTEEMETPEAASELARWEREYKAKAEERLT